MSRANVSGFAPRPGAGVRGVEFIEVREGRAQADAAGPVLVELAVAVVVEALGIELPDALFALRPVGLLHQARIAGDGHPSPFGVLDPDLGDEAVAVEVVGAVLVRRVVLVVVLRAGVPAVEPLGLGEIERRGVGIAAGQDVPGPVGPQVGLAAEALGQPERGLGGERDRPVHVGRDEDGRQGLGGLGRFGPDLEQDEVAAAGALGQDVDLGEGGIGLGQVLESGGDLLGLVVAVEGEVGRGQGPEGRTNEGDGEDGGESA